MTVMFALADPSPTSTSYGALYLASQIYVYRWPLYLPVKKTHWWRQWWWWWWQWKWEKEWQSSAEFHHWPPLTVWFRCKSLNKHRMRMLYYCTTVCTTAVMQCVSQCDTVQFSLVLWKPCLSIVMLRLQVRFSLGVKSLATPVKGGKVAFVLPTCWCIAKKFFCGYMPNARGDAGTILQSDLVLGLFWSHSRVRTRCAGAISCFWFIPMVMPGLPFSSYLVWKQGWFGTQSCFGLDGWSQGWESGVLGKFCSFYCAKKHSWRFILIRG